MTTVYPIEWEPPVKTGAYRNLQRRDFATWERWLDAHGDEFVAVAYDVAIGGALPDDPTATDEQRAGWRYTTALKIDVLLDDGAGLWVVEIKPAASVSALGAALAYPKLLAVEEPALDLLGGAIICDHLPHDLAWLTRQFNVRTWVV